MFFILISNGKSPVVNSTHNQFSAVLSVLGKPFGGRIVAIWACNSGFLMTVNITHLIPVPPGLAPGTYPPPSTKVETYKATHTTVLGGIAPGAWILGISAAPPLPDSPTSQVPGSGAPSTSNSSKAPCFDGPYKIGEGTIIEYAVTSLSLK
ncbi:hypothetical protein GW950_00445 [Candidatus Wolfebacteria bacterium]|nr:hypothetical protein [Candidatus Wolfebacteria bacterium]